MEIFSLEIFFSSYRNFQTILCLFEQLFYRKKFNRCAGPYQMFEKVKKSYECPKQSSIILVGLRFKDMRFLNKCSTLRQTCIFFSSCALLTFHKILCWMPPLTKRKTSLQNINQACKRLLRWMLLRRRITSGSINTVLNYLNTCFGKYCT